MLTASKLQQVKGNYINSAYGIRHVFKLAYYKLRSHGRRALREKVLESAEREQQAWNARAQSSRQGHCTTKNTNKLAMGSFYKNKTLKEEDEKSRFNLPQF